MVATYVKLDRRFVNTRVDPSNKAEWSKFLMDLNMYLDDISRVVNSDQPVAGSLNIVTTQVADHSALTTGVHGVGASSVESTAGSQAKANTAQAAAILAANTYTNAQIIANKPVRGTATLAGGTVTVSNASITANSLVFISINGPGTLANLGIVYEDTASRVPGVSFVIKSANALCNATVVWHLWEP